MAKQTRKAPKSVKYPSASFRLGDLGGEVQARGDYPGITAKRDLVRYYLLLRRALPPLTLDEAAFLIEAVYWDISHGDGRRADLKNDQESWRSRDLVREYRGVLWTVVRTAIEIFSLEERYEVHPPELESKLRDLHPCQEIALLDAIERAWQLRESDAREAAIRVGLAHERNEPPALG